MFPADVQTLIEMMEAQIQSSSVSPMSLASNPIKDLSPISTDISTDETLSFSDEEMAILNGFASDYAYCPSPESEITTPPYGTAATGSEFTFDNNMTTPITSRSYSVPNSALTMSPFRANAMAPTLAPALNTASYLHTDTSFDSFVDNSDGDSFFSSPTINSNTIFKSPVPLGSLELSPILSGPTIDPTILSNGDYSVTLAPSVGNRAPQVPQAATFSPASNAFPPLPNTFSPPLNTFPSTSNTAQPIIPVQPVTSTELTTFAAPHAAPHAASPAPRTNGGLSFAYYDGDNDAYSSTPVATEANPTPAHIFAAASRPGSTACPAHHFASESSANTPPSTPKRQRRPRVPRPPSGGFTFVLYTVDDADMISAGVAPSGGRGKGKNKRAANDEPDTPTKPKAKSRTKKN